MHVHDHYYLESFSTAFSTANGDTVWATQWIAIPKRQYFFYILIALLHVMLYHFNDCLFKHFLFLSRKCVPHNIEVADIGVAVCHCRCRWITSFSPLFYSLCAVLSFIFLNFSSYYCSHCANGTFATRSYFYLLLLFSIQIILYVSGFLSNFQCNRPSASAQHQQFNKTMSAHFQTVMILFIKI